MRYWRHYPKFLQTILLMLMIYTLTSFSYVLANFGVNKIYGESMDKLSSLATLNLIHAAQFVQGLTSLFTFMLSALLFAYLTHPSPAEYLGLRKFRNINFVFLVIPLMIAAVFVFAQIGDWMQHIDFGKGAKASFEEQQRMMKTMMQGNSRADLILYLLLFALLPALGEELLFRGVVMKFAYNNGQNIHFAILFSAAIFGLAHGSVYNFLPIMLAGVLLGYLYYLSGSIWTSIIAHFLNNAIGVYLLFLGNKGILSKELSEATSIPWYWILLASVLIVFILFLLRKIASPLPIDWNDDFKEERLTN